MERQSQQLFTAVSNTGFANTISYKIFCAMNKGIDKSQRLTILLNRLIENEN